MANGWSLLWINVYCNLCSVYYGGATKGDIAKHFGVAKQTIYRFFKLEEDELVNA
jgi:hypothetical protein